VHVPAQIRDAILDHSDACAPEEACGLLAGDRHGLTMAYCLTNAQHSPVAYTIEPEEHFQALRHAEAHGWQIVGTFHSHPNSEPFPSSTDRRLANESDWVYLISGRNRQVRAYYLRGGTVAEEPLEIEA
jgi:proteasome lid subunit RPN8/RPN11